MRVAFGRVSAMVVAGLLAVLLSAGVAFAQPRVNAGLASERGYVGVPMRMTVIVDNAGQNPWLQLPDDPAGYQIEIATHSDSSRSHRQINNGRVVENRQWVLRRFVVHVTPTVEGVIEVAPMTVTDGPGGDSLGVRTPRLEFVAGEVAGHPDVFVELRVSDDEPWVGERFEIEFVIGVADGGEFNNLSLLWNGEPGAKPDWLRTAAAESWGRGVRGAVLLGEPLRVVTERTAREIEGRRFRVFVAKLYGRVDEAGSFRLGPLSLGAELEGGSRGWRENIAVASNAVEIETRALPDEAPAGFGAFGMGGLIGEYRVETTVSEAELRVGDPVEFAVTLFGEPTAEGMMAPDVSSMPGFDAFRVRPVNEGRGDVVMQNRERGVRFVYTLRPARGGVPEVPAVSLTYFDVEEGAFREASSEAIPIEVRGGEVVTLSDAETGEAVRDVERGVRLEDEAGALAPNAVGPGVLRGGEFDVRSAVLTPAMLTAIAAPPAVYAAAALGVAVAGRRRSREVGPRGARAAAREAMAELHGEGDAAGRAERALIAYASARRGVDGAGITASEAVALIGEERPDLADDARRVARDAEAARYGGGAGADERVLDEARELLSGLSSRGGAA